MSDPDSKPLIKRAMLKLSGEAFGSRGIDGTVLRTIAEEVKGAFEVGTELVIVVGGGNFIRGAELDTSVIQRANADYMGMLATVINAVALQDSLESIGVPAMVQSTLRIDAVAEPFTRRRALRHLEKRRVLILGSGTGKPYVTTDTAAAQGALELGCEVLFKATKVDGVYSSDPHRDPTATRYDHLTFEQVIAGHGNIRVMDMTAISLCMDHDLPIVVFDLHKTGSIRRAVQGDPSIGTTIARRPFRQGQGSAPEGLAAAGDEHEQETERG